jgi:hypothetical protein
MGRDIDVWHGDNKGNLSWRVIKPAFWLRRQSRAATALFSRRSKQSGVALRFPPHSKMPPNQAALKTNQADATMIPIG